MFLRTTYLLLLTFSVQFIAAQSNLQASTVPPYLVENANAVVRCQKVDISIASQRSMNIKEQRVVTVFNEHGLQYLNMREFFDNETSVKSIEAVIYDSNGKEIKKFKRKDFKEYSLNEGSLITDNRVLDLDYVPISYPVTLVYSSEVQTSDTAFIPSWSPIGGLFLSVENSEVNITCPEGLGFRYKQYNTDNIKITSSAAANTYSFSVKNVPAIKAEEYSPSMDKTLPYVLFATDKFNLAGVNGEAKDWKSFGTWMYASLLEGTDVLPEATIATIKSKMGTETDQLKKAKMVYEYVQSKTRYISIQLGIGGWKPMLAKDVDRLGYGDCKALTNYTKALLKAVGVDSYYAVVYSGGSRRDIKEDFVSMQGNHVILAIPHNNSYVWLECTSQTVPFGFQGVFTDDRKVLLIKPEGGQIVHTNVYAMQDNTQISTGHYFITEAGQLVGNINIKSKGIQYDNKYYLESKSKDDLEKRYKEGFSNIGNLKLKKMNLINNKEVPEFTEDIAIEAENYCNKSGDKLIFAVNAFNQTSHVPQRYRARKNPFEITRGFYDADEVVIELPAGFGIEAKPDNIKVNDKFGEYTAEYELLDNNKLLFKRTLRITPGLYASNEYENYRLFRERVARNDNAKIVLVKI